MIKLKAIRVEKRLIRKKVAEDTGISVQALARIENGKLSPRIDVLVKLANYYGVFIEEIVNCK